MAWVYDCAECGADRHLLCELCGMPLFYRRGDRWPLDAHGGAHHVCPPEPPAPVEQADWPEPTFEARPVTKLRGRVGV